MEKYSCQSTVHVRKLSGDSGPCKELSFFTRCQSQQSRHVGIHTLWEICLQVQFCMQSWAQLVDGENVLHLGELK